MATGICWQYMGYFETQQLVILYIYNNIYIHIYLSKSLYINIYIYVYYGCIQQFDYCSQDFRFHVSCTAGRFRSATGFSVFFLGALHEGKKDHWTDHKEQHQQVPHLSGSNDWNPRIGRCFDQGIQARMIGAKATANLGCNFFWRKRSGTFGPMIRSKVRLAKRHEM